MCLWVFMAKGSAKTTSRNDSSLREMLLCIQKPLSVALSGDSYVTAGNGSNASAVFVPRITLENLGDPAFCRDHGIRYPYIAGSMAQGISSAQMVEALANAGMLGFLGAAGLPLKTVEENIDRLSRDLGDKPFGANLIHSPNAPKLEAALVDLCLRKNVRLIEASAYLDLALPLVRYRVKGIQAGPSGQIITPNRIMAKVSRIEVAAKFFSPAPEDLLQELVKTGEISREQAELARKIPMAQDLTAEADSGGHTDNRPAIALLPTMLALRDRLQAKYNFSQKLRLGMGGGISTPASAAAAFAMGADYIMTGSVNQACVESGTSEAVREILSQTEQADVIMAPAADMFEMGGRVQVLKRGTLFAMRAQKLYQIYQAYAGWEDVPAAERAAIEKNFFQASFDEVWQGCCEFFEERDTAQIGLAGKKPRHKMALVFRWYLSQASRWAIAGDAARRIDYQIWCGPSMGAFNEWTKGTFLEEVANRKVVTVALNLLYGAALTLRLVALRAQGVDLMSELSPRPMEEERIRRYLA